MDICLERADLLTFRLCCVFFMQSYAVLIACVPFPWGVWGSMWYRFLIIAWSFIEHHYRNDPMFSDRQVWANSRQSKNGAVWSESTLFAIPSASFVHITLSNLSKLRKLRIALQIYMVFIFKELKPINIKIWQARFRWTAISNKKRIPKRGFYGPP